MQQWETDAWHMGRALELAARGEGYVEPNPMVGCTIVRDGHTVGEGFHRRHGGPHAEVEALNAAGSLARGATAYVTLEPCCHQGKTPPCTQALIRAGITRVVVAQADPFPQVSGGGIAELRAAGMEVEVGLMEAEARELTAPYLKLTTQGRPWLIAKWAMTLDGKLSTQLGDSRWISCEASREVVHRLRGRMDGILIGRGTAERDDPLLTARPPGARTPARIVIDTQGSLKLASQLVRTAHDVPVIVAVGSEASPERIEPLVAAGCDVVVCAGDTAAERVGGLLNELGKRRMTNVLVEGGPTLLGSLFDLDAIDEVHAFIAPLLVGGAHAPSALAGRGKELMSQATSLRRATIECTGSDVYIRGRIR